MKYARIWTPEGWKFVPVEQSCAASAEADYPDGVHPDAMTDANLHRKNAPEIANLMDALSTVFGVAPKDTDRNSGMHEHDKHHIENFKHIPDKRTDEQSMKPLMNLMDLLFGTESPNAENKRTDNLLDCREDKIADEFGTESKFQPKIRKISIPEGVDPFEYILTHPYHPFGTQPFGFNPECSQVKPNWIKVDYNGMCHLKVGTRVSCTVIAPDAVMVQDNSNMISRFVGVIPMDLYQKHFDGDVPESCPAIVRKMGINEYYIELIQNQPDLTDEVLARILGEFQTQAKLPQFAKPDGLSPENAAKWDEAYKTYLNGLGKLMLDVANALDA